ncbi:glycosyl transferase family 2 [Aurantimonas sp. A2-1-M11]|uniref:glycosyl transferase family 2 n=1 Tax=Aurantimonas sp. A2-1-M11 TaxID=3113712 RepID=UPI002F93DE4A
MLSVFMDCGPEDQWLAASLASLIPGAVEGLVREVVLVDRGMDENARKVADHAGCRIVAAGDFRTAIEAARGDWLLLLEPGARLLPGWMEAVVEHADQVGAGRATTPAARFRRSPNDRPGFFVRFRQIRTAMAEGFLVQKRQAIGLSKLAFSLEEVAKGVAVTRMRAFIRPAVRGSSGN